MSINPDPRGVANPSPAANDLKAVGRCCPVGSRSWPKRANGNAIPSCLIRLLDAESRRFIERLALKNWRTQPITCVIGQRRYLQTSLQVGRCEQTRALTAAHQLRALRRVRARIPQGLPACSRSRCRDGLASPSCSCIPSCLRSSLTSSDGCP